MLFFLYFDFLRYITFFFLSNFLFSREAQKCYCGAENCSGYIGGAKQISVDAYGGSKSLPSRKRKGSEDKRKDFENMAVSVSVQCFYCFIYVLSVI